MLYEVITPIEEAKAYKVLINDFKLKQADVAKKVGKERTTITNSIRLLNLPEKIQEGLVNKFISSGHAKVLLSLQDGAVQLKLYDEIVDKGLSVRALETLIKAFSEDETDENHNNDEKISQKSPQIKRNNFV